MPAAQRLAARRRRRRRTLRLAAAVAATLALASSVAIAGFSILGSPAPPAVKRDLLDVDRGMPRDLRLNPDVARAHAVAAADGSVVYYAALRGGGYCAELVTADGRARGAVCSGTARRGLSVTVPFTDPVRRTHRSRCRGASPTASARSVELVYPDGGHDTAALGARGFYVADVPAAHLRAVHADGLMLIARDADGAALAQAVVPERRDHATERGRAPARPDRARHGQHRRRPHEGAARARRRPCPRRRPRHCSAIPTA